MPDLLADLLDAARVIDPKEIMAERSCGSRCDHLICDAARRLAKTCADIDAAGGLDVLTTDRRYTEALAYVKARGFETLADYFETCEPLRMAVKYGPDTPASPLCIRCGGPTELYGRFHTTEWNCKDAEGCGSYVLMSDRIGTDGGKVEPEAPTKEQP